MNRRQFISLGGLGGYSLMVRAEGAISDPAVRGQDRPPEPRPPSVTPAGSAAAVAAEPHMAWVDLDCDVFVAGGGMAGVCAAVAAARHGARVVLVQDRSRLGGNASSEVKMHIVGADGHNARPGWREGGLIEEFRLDDAVHNPHRSWELWDLLLYDKVKREPNIRLLLDNTLFAAATAAGRLEHVLVRCDKTEHLYRVRAPLFLDCTGDSRLALEAGAEFRQGREARLEFNETLALEQADRQTLGSSILFTARDYGRPIPFHSPPWARKITKDQLRFRPVSSWEYGYWWIEWGGQLDTIRDNEQIRFALLSIVLGVWDYIKNSGDHPSSANWGMDWLGMIPGKRESRRILGDHILTQTDLAGQNGDAADAVAIGGWPLDDHPPSGFDVSEQPPFRSIKLPDVYNIPLRSLYSRNINNLMMAGRNLSATHVALSSARVMATCSVMGQAAGTAAALCARKNLLPRQLAQNPALLEELQQTLLRDDQTIKNRKNNDPLDLARRATVTASAEFESGKAENVINGFVRDLPGQWTNRWAAPVEPPGAWLELAWATPQRLRHIQLTFDTGFQRELTLSASDSVSARILRSPQPETVRDYEITCQDTTGAAVRLVRVEGNYQRLRRHDFPPVETAAVRIQVTATNGSDTARIYEVRCYG